MIYSSSSVTSCTWGFPSLLWRGVLPYLLCLWCYCLVFGFPLLAVGGVLPYLLYLLCHCLVFIGTHCLYSEGILGWLHLRTESMTMTIVEYRARRRYHNTKYEGFDCPLIRYKESGLRLCLVYQNWLVAHSYGWLLLLWTRRACDRST